MKHSNITEGVASLSAPNGTKIEGPQDLMLSLLLSELAHHQDIRLIGLTMTWDISHTKQMASHDKLDGPLQPNNALTKGLANEK